MYTQSSADTFTIEDVGNVCLVARNDSGDIWILVIKTLLGFCYILEYGPLNHNPLSQNYLISKFNKLQYSEYKLTKRIDNFLNDPKRMITQVDECNEEEAFSYMKSVVEVFHEAYQ